MDSYLTPPDPQPSCGSCTTCTNRLLTLLRCCKSPKPKRVEDAKPVGEMPANGGDPFNKATTSNGFLIPKPGLRSNHISKPSASMGLLDTKSVTDALKEPVAQLPTSTSIEQPFPESTADTYYSVNEFLDEDVSDTIDQPRPRIVWVIGLDFGTTHSGFAYHRVGDDPAQMYVVYDWPLTETEKLYSKTLTGLYYNETGHGQFECASWGYPARSKGMNHSQQGLYITHFKLLLKKDLNNPALVASVPSPLTVDRVVTDYLRCIGEHALAIIRTHDGEVDFRRDSVQWWVTVPSMWDEGDKRQMQACMVRAGLVSERAGGADAVGILLEPEAASFHCHQILRKQRLDVSLDVEDKILVADVGGGTVDVVVQQLIGGGQEYRVKALTKSSGGFSGGKFVDDSFMRFLSGKVGCLDEFLRSNRPSYKARLLKDWEAIKMSFGHEMISTDPMHVTLHHRLAQEWADYERERGNPLEDSSQVQLTPQELRSIFDPVVDAILQLIDAQLTQVPQVKVMFVVGGFAGSPYLMRRIRACFSGRVAHISCPPYPGSAIAQGAVSLALMHSRVATA